MLAGGGETPGRRELRAQRLSRNSSRRKPRGGDVAMDLLELREFIRQHVPQDSFDTVWAVVSAMYLELESYGRRNSSERRGHLTPHSGVSDGETVAAPVNGAEERPTSSEKPRRPTGNPNHKGRHTAKDYPHAEKFPAVLNGDLGDGRESPCGCGGRLREDEPTFALSFRGTCPIQAESHECRHYRCNKCQQRYSTKPAKGAADRRHQPSAISTIALLKYAFGLPFNRTSVMLGLSGIALAPTTLFEMCLKGARLVLPAFVELLEQGAQADQIGTDDTRAIILEGHRPEEFENRNGTRTTGLQCQTADGRKIAIFMTGVKHAGENLSALLERRRRGLAEATLMSDGLSHNAPKQGSPSVVAADCLVHARRYFVKLVDIFPERCQYVLELFGRVYAHEAHAKNQGLSPAARLALHQLESTPVLEKLRQLMEADLEGKLVEENSALGKAYRYMLKRWDGLTVFLRVEGAPLDNNAIERQLKKAILNRKNAYFYRSNRGALVGDIYMSLIYTCELNGVDPLDYLNKLQEHASELATNPLDWTPWMYQKTLDKLAICQRSTETLPRAA